MALVAQVQGLLLAWIASGVADAAAGVRKKKTWTDERPKEDGAEEEQCLLSLMLLLSMVFHI